jgi:hypothetical protein
MRGLRTGVVLLALASLASIAQESHCAFDPNRDTFRSWAKKTRVAEGRPYYASETRKSKIKTNYEKVTVGMKRSAVEQILGPPDVEEPFLTPRKHSSMTITNIESLNECGHRWVYYFSKETSNPIDNQDQGLFLFFGEEGKLYWVVPMNTKQLKEKGSAICWRCLYA